MEFGSWSVGILRESANLAPGNVSLAVLACAIAVGALFLLSSDGLLSGWTGFDLHYLAPWITASAVVFLFSRVATMAPVAHDRRSPEASDDAEHSGDALAGPAVGERDARRPGFMSACRMFLESLAPVVLIAGALSAVPDVPVTVSSHVDFPNVDTVVSYLQVFNSLAVVVVATGVLFTGARVAAKIWPETAAALVFPWKRLLVLAAAYVVLSGSGLLSVAFGFSGVRILLLLILTLALPYVASVLRHLASLSPSGGALIGLRVMLAVTECAWIALLLGMMVLLPGIANGYLDGQPQAVQDYVRPYFGILDTLSFWSIMLFGSFIVIRAIGAFRPAFGEVLGFPLGRIILFGLALLVFSENGVAATASQFPIPRLMPVLNAALAISYVALVLHRVGRLGLVPRFAGPVANIPPLIAAVVHASAWSVVVWTVANSAPLVSGPLLDNALTSKLGETSMPYLSGVFEIRNHLATLALVVALAFGLPDPLWAGARLRVRPLLAGVGFIASGCLLWLAGAQLSAVGHVFVMAGAVGGSGLLGLGITQLAAYWSDSQDPLTSSASRWLVSSKLRGFLIGASLAFYGMLLRPLIYDTLWFAPLYEWLVVLVVSAWAIVRIRGTLKAFVTESEGDSVALRGWDRHEQVLEDRPDPRWDLFDGWRQRYLESGEWSSLWSYLMGLLCRNNAPPESARDVFRPLRRSAASPSRIPFFPGGRRRGQSAREAALGESLRNAARALEGGQIPPERARGPDMEDAAVQFIEDGSDPEAMAAMMIGEYNRRGADLDDAVNLWYPIVRDFSRPERWFEPPWVRRRNRIRSRTRRRRLVEGALAHLSGQVSHSSLPVAMTTRSTPVFPSAMSMSRYRPAPATKADAQGNLGGGAMSPYTRHQLRAAGSRGARPRMAGPLPFATISAGQGVEVLDEYDDTYYVRTSDNLVGHIYKSDLRRRPILPGDEVDGT